MATMSFVESGKLVGLLRKADPQGKMKVRVLTSTRLAIGSDPLNPDWTVDLSKEEISPYATAQSTSSGQPSHIHEANVQNGRIVRRRGAYWFELSGKRTACGSLRDVLRTGLVFFEKDYPGTYEKLSHVMPRSKRIVARDPKLLFESPHLVKKYSEKLGNGWWMGTNNSASEVEQWLDRAAECAGLTRGVDYDWGS